MTVKKSYISKLIDQGEGLHLDFKFEISDAAKIARSLSAFANTSGGKLLIGVKDNGVIRGIKSEEEYFMIENAATRYCFPEVSFTSKEWNIGGKKVLEISIPKSDNKPHKAPDHNNKAKAYIRVDDQNILANSVQMKVWQKLKTNNDISLVYTDKVKTLLEVLNNHNFLSLSQIINHADMPKHTTENILAKLIIMNVISMRVSEDSEEFTLCDPD